jgi:hypothetical protein
VRALISTLVATAVALHSVLGCCWHHAHAAEGCEPTAQVAGHDEHEHEVASQESEHPCGCPHRHAADLADERPAALAEDCRHGDLEHGDLQHGEHDHGGPCPQPCPGSCVDKGLLVAAPRVQLEHVVSTVLPAALSTARQSSLEFKPSPAEFAGRPAATYPPPERLHLLYQLLLI